MPRKCAVPKEVAIGVLYRYMDHFKNGSHPPYGSKVWDDLAKECDGAWNRLSWWANVTNDQRGILSKARQDLGVEVPKGTDKWDSTSVHSDISFHGTDSDEEKGESWFKLVLTQEQWTRIKPVNSDVNEGKRKDHTLRANVWTNEIADEFYKQYGLPCAYSFRRGEINISSRSRHYLKIEGQCRAKDCGNYFHGYLDKEPLPMDERIIIRVRTQNTSREVHDDVRQFLNGERRKVFGEQSHAEGASNMLKRLRRENMGRGETEGPNFPKADVLRHAQHEHVNRDLEMQKSSQDFIQKIYGLQFEKPFMGPINAIGYNPLYAVYVLPLQITLYQDYRKIMGDWSSICIDGTGSLVRKVVRVLGIQSGHIFLHSIVIHFDNKMVSVSQMLSESQQAETFTFWLRKWLNLVGVKPKQSTTDYSRALLTGTSKAFNDMTVKDYLNVYFSFLRRGDPSKLNTISTFLRVDVAHLIHIICRWDCTKAIQRRQVRDFFIRCVAIMVDCQHLTDFDEIFTLTCAVGSNSHHDTVLNLRPLITVTQAREKLETFMSKRNVSIEDEFAKTRDIEEEDEIPFQDDEDGPSSIESHIKKLLIKATSVIHEGTELNSFYVPKFIQQLVRLGYEFILWTAIGVPFVVGHASSSYNEKSFQDLKHKVLKRYSRRINLEKFMRIHMRDLNGASKEVADKLIKFTVQNKTLPEILWKTCGSKRTRKTDVFDNPTARNPMGSLGDHCDELSESIVNDSDLFSRENWRGKAEPGLFDPCSYSSSTEGARGAPTTPRDTTFHDHDYLGAHQANEDYTEKSEPGISDPSPYNSNPDEARGVSNTPRGTAFEDHHHVGAHQANENDGDHVGNFTLGDICNNCDEFVELGMFSRHVCSRAKTQE